VKDHKQIGRLAIREEGLWVNAYYAMPGTSEPGESAMFCISTPAVLCVLGIAAIALGIWWAWHESH
jgi:hypothetical protein